MKRKYPKTTGHYPYYHRLPNKMCYFGESGQQPCDRWKPSAYKNTALGPYIEEIGWDNIEHIVIQDGLTKRQAEVIEDWFIKNATKDGFCINERRSGGIERDNPNAYKREYCQRPGVKERQHEYDKKRNQTEKRKEYNREYDKKRSQTEKRKEYRREYMCDYEQRPEVKQRIREYMREYRLKKKALKN